MTPFLRKFRYHRIVFVFIDDRSRSGFDRITFSKCFRTELKQADLMKEMKTGQLKTQKIPGNGFCQNRFSHLREKLVQLTC
jgi:hypothetical protein